MKILVTAGNTQVPIDRVRCITNLFTGHTGAQIAYESHARGHDVTLFTSHPEGVVPLFPDRQPPAARWSVLAYVTFDDLQDLLSGVIARNAPDAIVHCAAVSDYLACGIFAPAPGTGFDAGSLTWQGSQPTMVSMAAGKVKSDAPELWLRLVRAPKLIDRMRSNWDFRGLLVKFKLEVGITEERLQEIAEISRRQSSADLMVANTLEGSKEWALLGPLMGQYQRIPRAELAAKLLDAIEALQRVQPHG